MTGCDSGHYGVHVVCCARDSDVTEKPIELIKVYSDKELIREFEKIASTLVPEKDWSIRIGAMQKVEGLVIGGLLLPFPSVLSIFVVLNVELTCNI
ncbi:hypothetical protein U1Q18_025788 [Sarracenia purpurea var. burkii]